MWKEKEYLELLESNGIDTVCFMGSGYRFEAYRIGQEFYFPFAWYEVEANVNRGFDIEECLKKIARYGREPLDRFELIKKYEFRLNKLFGGRIRYEKCLVKNLRSGEVTELKDKDIDKFFYCIMVEPK